MEIILKHKGEEVARLGQANVFIFQNGRMPDNDEINRNSEGMHDFILKKMLSRANFSPSYEELEYVESEVTGMITDFEMSCQDTGRMYLINNILENKDFTVEFE